MNRLLFELACSFAAMPNVQPCSTQQGRPVGDFLFLPHLLWNNFDLDKAADLIYDKAEGCCPEKWGGGGCPEEEI